MGGHSEINSEETNGLCWVMSTYGVIICCPIMHIFKHPGNKKSFYETGKKGNRSVLHGTVSWHLCSQENVNIKS